MGRTPGGTSFRFFAGRQAPGLGPVAKVLLACAGTGMEDIRQLADVAPGSQAGRVPGTGPVRAGLRVPAARVRRDIEVPPNGVYTWDPFSQNVGLPPFSGGPLGDPGSFDLTPNG